METATEQINELLLPAPDAPEQKAEPTKKNDLPLRELPDGME